MSDRLPPIPTPASQFWRNIRLQYVPVLVFLLGLVAAIVIWTEWVAPPTLVGEAEAVRTELRSAQSGRIIELKRDVLQPVKAGDVIGQVMVNEPRLLEASLAVIRAEMEVLRATTRLAVEQQQLDLLSKRVQLVALRGQLQQAEATLARTAALHRTKLVTDEEFDQAKAARDSAAAQVEAQTALVSRTELALAPSTTQQPQAVPSPNDTLRASIKQREDQLQLVEAQLGPVPLIAPIDGIVTLVYRRAGEAVAAAEPILQISANAPQRIVGFLRPPLTLDPKPGMAVEVRTRTFQRRAAEASITQVGLQFEPISPSLLAALRLPVSAVPTEFGLRIHVDVPPSLALRPGEQVDLILQN